MITARGGCACLFATVGSLIGSQAALGQSSEDLLDALRAETRGQLLLADQFLNAQAFPSLSVDIAPLQGPFDPGNLRLAVGETLTSNFVTWLFDEYVMDYKDITRISPTTWKNNLSAGPIWDDNHFNINMLAHPYQGSLFYNAGRSNGYNFEKSFLFTLLGSALWECCGESHRPSWNDLVTTTLGGTGLGEIAYRSTGELINRVYRSTPPNYWWEVLVAPLAPTRTFSRWVLGRFTATNHPTFVLPQSRDLFAYGGYRTGPGGGFIEGGYTYGDVNALLSGLSRPFTHFEAIVELDFGQMKERIGRFQARGSLWPLRTPTILLDEDCEVAGVGPLQLETLQEQLVEGIPGIPEYSECDAFYLRVIPYQGFDYINNDSYEFGGQSLGAATFATLGTYPYGTHGIIAVDGHLLFAGIQSEYAHKGKIHDGREREREYDFGWGFGWGLAGILGIGPDLRLSAFYRRNHSNVLDGSNVDGYEADHDTGLFGGTLTWRLLGKLGIGVDYRQYERESIFTNPTFSMQMTSQNHHRWGVFLTWDTRRRPLGLFVF